MAEFGGEVKRVVILHHVSHRGGITDVDTVDLNYLAPLFTWHSITPQQLTHKVA